MKYPQKLRYAVIAVVLCSVVSSLYLEFRNPSSAFFIDQPVGMDQYIKESTYMPDIKFVKEILKTFFNVVNS